MQCKNKKHVSKVSNFYNGIVNVIKCCSDKYVCGRVRKSHKKTAIDWNTHLSTISISIARKYFLEWVSSGKLSAGIYFRRMKTSRTQ